MDGKQRSCVDERQRRWTEVVGRTAEADLWRATRERAQTQSRQGQSVFGDGLNSGRWRQISLRIPACKRGPGCARFRSARLEGRKRAEMSATRDYVGQTRSDARTWRDSGQVTISDEIGTEPPMGTPIWQATDIQADCKFDA